MSNKKTLILAIILVTFFTNIFVAKGLVNDGFHYNSALGTVRVFKAVYLKGTKEYNVEKQIVYSKAKKEYTAKFCWIRNSSREMICFTTAIDSAFPKIFYTDGASRFAKTGGNGAFGITLDSSKTTVDYFTNYKCNYVLNGNVLKVEYNQDGNNQIYYNNTSIEAKLASSVGKLLVLSNRNYKISRADNASDFIFTGGSCPGYAYYNDGTDAKSNAGVLFTTTSNGETNGEFSNWLFTPKGSVDVFNFSKDTSTGPKITISVSDVSGCGTFGVETMNIIHDIFNLIKVLVVVGLIAFGMTDFARAVMSGEAEAMKKATKRFTNRIIIAILIFLLPILIDFIIVNFFGGSLASCVKYF